MNNIELFDKYRWDEQIIANLHTNHDQIKARDYASLFESLSYSRVEWELLDVIYIGQGGGELTQNQRLEISDKVLDLLQERKTWTIVNGEVVRAEQGLISKLKLARDVIAKDPEVGLYHNNIINRDAEAQGVIKLIRSKLGSPYTGCLTQAQRLKILDAAIVSITSKEESKLKLFKIAYPNMTINEIEAESREALVNKFAKNIEGWASHEFFTRKCNGPDTYGLVVKYTAEFMNSITEIERPKPVENHKAKISCSKCKLTWYDKEDDAKCPDCGRKGKCLESSKKNKECKGVSPPTPIRTPQPVTVLTPQLWMINNAK
jgi:hypothetical protein